MELRERRKQPHAKILVRRTSSWQLRLRKAKETFYRLAIKKGRTFFVQPGCSGASFPSSMAHVFVLRFVRIDGLDARVVLGPAS